VPYLDVLVHRATPLLTRATGGLVEGRRSIGQVPGTPFDCCLFLPQGSKSADGRGRRVREPTLLVAPEDDLGMPVQAGPEDELLIVAPELNVAEGLPAETAVRYRIAGEAQPFGKPGNDIIGRQLTLVRVDD